MTIFGDIDSKMRVTIDFKFYDVQLLTEIYKSMIYGTKTMVLGNFRIYILR